MEALNEFLIESAATIFIITIVIALAVSIFKAIAGK